MEELSGANSGVEDPFGDAVDAAGGHRLYAHQDDIIRQAEALAARIGI